MRPSSKNACMDLSAASVRTPFASGDRTTARKGRANSSMLNPRRSGKIRTHTTGSVGAEGGQRLPLLVRRVAVPYFCKRGLAVRCSRYLLGTFVFFTGTCFKCGVVLSNSYALRGETSISWASLLFPRINGEDVSITCPCASSCERAAQCISSSATC